MLTCLVQTDCAQKKNFAFMRKIMGKMFAYMRKKVYLCT